ncbi:MAG: class I SAM-dependent methyltransferase [Myxococcaceae bacterium]|nr:class I SAM-dependent methyltransferase [Myxococcaceae bacterium]
MSDLFSDKAHDWDTRPVPAQISEGVSRALMQAIALSPTMTVLDFGAGTGLVCAKLAPHVGRILAVDISAAMLEQLKKKPELEGKVEVYCQDLVAAPLPAKVDLVVSAMAMHHVRDTAGLLASLHTHLKPGGRVALADLDSEDGSFHPPGTEGVFHTGFAREALGALLESAGFRDVRFVTACEVLKEGRAWPVFLVTATRR